jgi:hypothetical protein
MCIGGQDIPVTLRVDGGIEDGQWQSASDVRDTPTPQEEVQVTEATETEVMEPSSPLYKPVIERIDKLSERLPEKVAGETVEEMQPMVQHGFQMADRNQVNTMQMLDRIMRNTRPRRPFSPRGDGPLGKGGGRGNPRVPRPRYQTLGATPRVASDIPGLAGLLGSPQQPKYNERTGGDPNISTPIQFPKQQMATPMQPEVIEEQQQMEILGQPKQFAGGGLVNALMATPVGQAELRKYAEGGEIKFGDYVFDYSPTGDDPLDILRGMTYDDGRKARFFSSEAHMKDPSQPVVKWGKPDVVKEITEDLTPVRRKKKKEEPHDGDSQVPGGAPSEARTAANNWGYIGNTGRGLMTAAGLATGLPLGLLGAVNDYQAMNMGRTGWSTQFSPSFFDVLTMGLFAEPGYDQSVLNMENRNIAGRHGLLGDPNSKFGQSKFIDYTHKYGTEEPITEQEEKDYQDLVGQVEALDPGDWDVDEAGEEGEGDMDTGMDNSAQDSTPSADDEESGSESSV